METVEQKKTQRYAVKDCAANLAVKDVDATTRTVAGFYNTFNFLDSDGDVLLPGSAKRSIKNNGPRSAAVAKIKHALFHDLTQLPGKIEVLEEREIDGVSGIYFETKMMETTLGNDTLLNYEGGVYDNHSIGFRYVDIRMVERDSKDFQKIVDQLLNPAAAEQRNAIFVVKEIELWEGSTVAFGANENTPFLGMAKSMTKAGIMMALSGKIDKLQKAVASGRQSDDMLSILDLQCKQLQRMLDDLADYVQVPDPRKDAIKTAAAPVKLSGLDGFSLR